MDTLAEALLESPLLPRQLERLNQVMAEERLHRERFYEEMTEERKWEFINGEVIMHSPAKRRHINASDNLLILLKTHARTHDLGWVAHEKVLVTLTRNDYEPDISFFRKEIADTFPAEQMQFPAPNFIAEVISLSTARTDRGIKFRDYAAHGVAEYWLVDPAEQTVAQYVLEGDSYQPLGFWKEGDTITSVTVSGFKTAVSEIFRK